MLHLAPDPICCGILALACHRPYAHAKGTRCVRGGHMRANSGPVRGQRRETPMAAPPGIHRPAWSLLLRALREARGYTQDAWADWLGVGRKTVQRWEWGA